MRFGFFDTKEFESKDGAKGGPYGETIVSPDLLHILNRIRSSFGKPIIVNSGYRTPQHNERVGGVKNSLHVRGLAADIRPQDLADLPKLQALCLEMNKLGGVGLYDTFVHVDVRGKKARWDCRK